MGFHVKPMADEVVFNSKTQYDNISNVKIIWVCKNVNT